MNKIKTILGKTEYEYDSYALLTSFFPGREVITKSDATDYDGTFKMEEKDGLMEFSIDFEGIKAAKSYEVSDKISLGVALYDFLSEVTKKELCWGNLTGIRPTKLIRTLLEEEAKKKGLSADDASVISAVEEKLYKERRLKGEKFVQGADIAIREKEILSNLHEKNGYSVYIGIPFCPSTCLYCSFTSNPIFKYRKRIDEYIDAMIKELEWTRDNMKDYVLDTVYIGGGTPTTLEPAELDRLLSKITTILPWENVKEFTVEAGRADSITREKLEVLKKYPVTRISVNPQTMRDETLKFIGRNHTVADVKDKFHLARELGFDNINMDIILGLPGETTEDVKYTLEEIKKLAPDSLTVHSLAIKRASRLKKWMDDNNMEITMDYEEAMRISNEAAEEMNLKPYYLYRQKQMAGNMENIGFASEGKYGLYNILIMEEVQTIIACGAGTVTKRVYGDGRIERCDNVKDVALYISKIEEMIDRKRQLFKD